MALNAFKNGVSVLDEATLNSLLSAQEVALIYEGISFDSVTGTGIAEFDNASYNYAIKALATGVTEFARLELEVIKNGEGADLIVEIREGLIADGSSDGVLLKSICYPKEFLPVTKGWISIPLDLTGLTQNAAYWIIIKSAGDTTNHFHVHGETSVDATHTVYKRTGDSGAWSSDNAIHFKLYAGENNDLKHSLYGGGGHTTMIYSGEDLTLIYRYMPPIDGTAGGIRDIYTITWNGENIKRGSVT